LLRAHQVAHRTLHTCTLRRLPIACTAHALRLHISTRTPHGSFTRSRFVHFTCASCALLPFLGSLPPPRVWFCAHCAARFAAAHWHATHNIWLQNAGLPRSAPLRAGLRFATARLAARCLVLCAHARVLRAYINAPLRVRLLHLCAAVTTLFPLHRAFHSIWFSYLFSAYFPPVRSTQFTPPHGWFSRIRTGYGSPPPTFARSFWFTVLHRTGYWVATPRRVHTWIPWFGLRGLPRARLRLLRFTHRTRTFSTALPQFWFYARYSCCRITYGYHCRALDCVLFTHAHARTRALAHTTAHLFCRTVTPGSMGCCWFTARRTPRFLHVRFTTATVYPILHSAGLGLPRGFLRRAAQVLLRFYLRTGSHFCRTRCLPWSALSTRKPLRKKKKKKLASSTGRMRALRCLAAGSGFASRVFCTTTSCAFHRAFCTLCLTTPEHWFYRSPLRAVCAVATHLRFCIPGSARGCAHLHVYTRTAHAPPRTRLYRVSHSPPPLRARARFTAHHYRAALRAARATSRVPARLDYASRNYISFFARGLRTACCRGLLAHGSGKRRVPLSRRRGFAPPLTPSSPSSAQISICLGSAALHGLSPAAP